MVFTKKTAKGRYKSISIPLINKEHTDNQIDEIKEIQRQSIANFIAHKGIELIPFGQSGNPEMIKKRGWGRKK
jgi:hypothetical protein